MSTTSSMEACGSLESEEWRVQVGSIGVGSPAHKEFWVVRGFEVVGINQRIDVQDWSLKYCYELGMDRGRTGVLYVQRGLGFSLCAAPPDVYCPQISGERQARVRRFRGLDDEFEGQSMSISDCFGTCKTIGVKEVHLITNGFDRDVKMAEEISNFYCSTTPEII